MAWNVTRVTRILPQSRMDRVRLGMTMFGVMLCLETLSPAVADLGAGSRSVLSIVAGTALVATLVTNQVYRGRITILLVPLPLVLLFLMGIGLPDPEGMLPTALGLTAALTMYGGRRSVVIRLVGLMVAVVLAAHLTLSPLVSTAVPSLATILASAPLLPLFTGLIYLLRNTLESQSITIAREGFMARLGSGLLAADTVEDITAVMVRGNHELREVSPGLVTLELVRVAPGEPGPVGGARMLNVHGIDRSDVPQYLPAAALAELPPIGVERDLPLEAGSAALTKLGLPARKWHAVALKRVPGGLSDLILYGVQASIGQKLFGVLTPEEQEFLDVMARQRRHWGSAMSRVLARDSLLDAEERDSVTGLPDRSLIMRRIIDLVQLNHEQAGLVLLQIAGLDQVEEQSGIAGIDTAMAQLAHRISGVVGDPGHVGRGGDNSFAVLLANADSHDDVEEIVDLLSDVILEPVLTPAGPVQLSLNIGIARTTEGGTAADLLERASSALALDAAGSRDDASTLEVGQG